MNSTNLNTFLHIFINPSVDTVIIMWDLNADNTILMFSLCIIDRSYNSLYGKLYNIISKIVYYGFAISGPTVSVDYTGIGYVTLG